MIPGDEVIVPAPYWTTYPEAIQLAGGVPVPVLADETQGFRHTVDQLEAARTPKTKVLLFVSPNNPTGAVHTPDEVKAIGEWALANDLWVVTDEIYEHLVYGDAKFTSMPVAVPEPGRPHARAQRCGQDLRDDGLARRLDDRAEGRDRRRHEPAKPRHVERVQRRPARRARRGARAICPRWR